MIELELHLRDMEAKVANMRTSLFRKTLFNECKSCFERFFNAEEKEKAMETKEKSTLFQLKLYGNLDFVGELYRRKILPETILNTVFDSLLGNSDMNDKIDDLVIEGAINLMTKVGQAYENNISQAKGK